MDISQINSSMPSLAGPVQRTSNGQAFSEVIEQFLGDVNGQQLQAESAVQRFVTGETDNVQEVMLALSQADLSFRMFVEVRNKVVDAYQEVMRLQL